MSFNLCPSCGHANPGYSKYCNACGGTLLVVCAHCNTTNRPGMRACTECGARLTLGAKRSAKVPSERVATPKARAPAVPAHEPMELALTDEPHLPSGPISRPMALQLDAEAAPAGSGSEFTLTLRGLDAVPGPSAPKADSAAPPIAEPPRKPAQPVPKRSLPMADPELLAPELLRLDAANEAHAHGHVERPSPEAGAAAAAAARGASDATASPEAERSARLVQRALVRRARAEVKVGSGRATAEVKLIDVLVLDDDETANHQLCDLLEGLGFRVHSAYELARAAGLVGAYALAAAFLVVELDGTPDGAAAALCEHIKPAQPRTHGRPTALVIIGTGEHAVDRVRATMIGADAFLPKPLTRGDVMRVLEDCGIELPRDARKH